MADAAFLALLPQASVPWRVLAEIQIRQGLHGWANEGSGAYSVAYSSYTHPAAIRTDRGMYRGLDAVWEGTTPLTLVGSVAAVKATPGTYYYDGTTLYVSTSGEVNPDTLSLIQAVGTLRVATHATSFSDQPPYLERLDGSRLPSVQASRPDLLYGITTYPLGDLSLTNGDGFWDYLAAVQGTDFQWINNTVQLYLGASSLTYAQYEPLPLMQMADAPQCGNTVATLQLRSLSNATDTAFPLHTLKSLYSSLVAGVNAKPNAYLPMFWGLVSEAPLVFAEPDGPFANKWVFGDSLSTGGSLANVVAILRADGTRTSLTHGVDWFSGAGTEISVTGYDPAAYALVGDVANAPYTCGAICLDILRQCGIPDSQIDTASFAQADIDNAAALGVWVGDRTGDDGVASLMSAADLINIIERSVIGSVNIGADGLWRMDIWDPSADLVSLDTLKDTDGIISLEPSATVSPLQAGVKVQCGRRVYSDSYDETTATSGRSSSSLQTDGTTTVTTVLANSDNAAMLASRLQWINSSPKYRIDVVASPAYMTKQVGDKVRVQRSRGPAWTGTFDQAMEIEAIDKPLATLHPKLTLTNQRGLGMSVKVVAPNGTPAWGSASAEERMAYAFAADTTTEMVDTADASTWHQALVW